MRIPFSTPELKMEVKNALGVMLTDHARPCPPPPPLQPPPSRLYPPLWYSLFGGIFPDCSEVAEDCMSFQGTPFFAFPPPTWYLSPCCFFFALTARGEIILQPTQPAAGVSVLYWLYSRLKSHPIRRHTFSGSIYIFSIFFEHSNKKTDFSELYSAKAKHSQALPSDTR